MSLIVTQHLPHVPDTELDRIWRGLQRQHEWSTLGDTRDSREWVRLIASETGAIEERVIESGVRVGVLGPELRLPEWKPATKAGAVVIPSDALTPEQAAKRLGLTPERVRQMGNAGVLAVYRHGRVVRYDREGVLRELQRRLDAGEVR